MSGRKRGGKSRSASRSRPARGRARGSGAGKAALWGGAVVVAVFAGFIGTKAAAASHPEPRPDAHSHHVASSGRYSEYARVAAIYAQAQEVKGVLDGVYCYCRCSEHSGHYSLLDCFKDDHAARCDICLSEAALAHKMNGEGKSLDQVRDAVDSLYGR